ncbi:Crp/Fnr family transcriptional regulator [Leptospirillum ferriphilum]|jgi:CRP-like cAMP-binding protein|uniref:cAMP-binding protein n=2 Tax=Leptospirillum TaxID=179 RepID=A0A094W5L0_9BACT|nr:Crp/Fnr family transcriptional regulator [Leptospirillum ferriphilum]EDZ39337.1 MAG: Putative transcriptional regulator, Crp/Fnr family [Leptospirillum sp. Group II '5-way CG']KGA92743.1 cAMP-binding protein [Leptospirillum ferriphilum]
MTNPESSDLHQAFQSVDLFKFLKAEELETLEKIVRLRNYRSGQKIIQEFDRGMELFVIVSGSVKISTEDVEGREIIVSIAYPSDFFGEIALLDDDTRSATVTAIEPTTVLSIEKNDFLRFFVAYPEFALRMLAVMGQRIRKTDEKLIHMAFADSFAKIARTLLTIYEKEGVQSNGSLPYIHDRFTRQELASLSGVSRETVSRSLGAFIQAELIRIADNRIYILNENKLRRESLGSFS